MTKMNTFSKIIILFISVLLFTSCNKDEVTEVDNSFTITSVDETNNIYAKQAANYKLNLPTNSNAYQVKVTANNEADLQSTLQINGAQVELDTYTNFTGGELNINMIPHAVGETSFTVEIKRGTVIKTKEISLISKMPKFEVQLNIDNDRIALGVVGTIQTTVNFIGNYGHNLIYKAEIEGVDVNTTPNAYDNVEGTPKPNLDFDISCNLIGAKNIKITVYNEFGFSASQVIAIDFYCLPNNC